MPNLNYNQLISKQEVAFLRALDAKILSKLSKNYTTQKLNGNKKLSRNPALSSFMKSNTNKNLLDLEKLLISKGTFKIAIESKSWLDLDRRKYKAYFARAAHTKMWPMGTHLWIRDNALIAARLIFNDNSRAQEKNSGKKILLSLLELMSSQAQLQRFDRIIKSKDRIFKSKAQNWPLIFLDIKNNLNSAKIDGWSNKQDAFQILAYYSLKAIEKRIILFRDLNKKTKKFLGQLIPFLIAIENYKQKNSGSWEEIEAIRSSVLAWEFKLIREISYLSKFPQAKFIEQTYGQYQRYLPPIYRKLSFREALEKLLFVNAQTLSKKLPYESSEYKKTSVEYRKADAALIYLLQLNTAEDLAEVLGKPIKWAENLENKIIKQIFTLIDPVTGGIKRYLGDSYQRHGFFRNETVKKLIALYGGPSGNASKNFRARHYIVPRGPEAAWTHFVWQLSAVFGMKYRKTRKKQFLQLQRKFFTSGLSLISGMREKSLEEMSNHEVRMIKIDPFRIPECYISENTSAGRNFRFPSPHTPLNWSIAEAKAAMSAMKTSLNSKK